MSRLLLALAILLTGCESFTLIGNLSVGLPADSVDLEEGDGGVDQVPSVVETVCWPSAKPAVAEMRRHGYDYRKPEWAETAEWFTKLEPVKNSLPPCPAE